MKLLTSGAVQKLNKATGTSPLLVLEVNWGGQGNNYYTSKDVKLSGINARPVILDHSEVSYIKRADSYGTNGSVSITLDDSDGHFKFLIDNTALLKRLAAVYLFFEESNTKDFIVLLKGEVVDPIIWSEGKREITFSIETPVENNEFGYAPIKDDLPDLSTNAEGVPWPYIFGKVNYSPTVHVRNRIENKITLWDEIRLDSDVFKVVQVDKKNAISLDVECKLLSYSSTSEIIPNNRLRLLGFASGVENEKYTLNVDGVLFYGTWHVDAGITGISDVGYLDCQQINQPIYTNVKIAARVSTDPDEFARVIDLKNFGLSYIACDIIWLQDTAINLINKHCYYKRNTLGIWNYCTGQIKNKCYFKNPFLDNKNKPQALASGILTEVFNIEKNGVSASVSEKLTKLISNFDFDLNYQVVLNALNSIRRDFNSFWRRPSGTEVALYAKKGENPDIYIISGNELDTIYGVFGKKSYLKETGQTEKVFTKLDPDYYIEKKKSDFRVKINGVSTDFGSALLMDQALQEVNKDWKDDQLYVSCKSKIEPNIADILYYILSNFSTYRLDKASFDEVHTLVDNQPANFTLIDHSNVLELCFKIAWQAKCTLINDSGTLYLRYLDKQPVSSYSFNADNIKLKSLEFFQSEVRDVYTRLVGSYTKDYKDSERITKHHTRKTRILREIIRSLTDDERVTKNETSYSVYENNIDKYGLISREEQFFIYTDPDSVENSLGFWGHRFSNTWRKASFESFLGALVLQPFDGVTLDLPTMGINVPILGVVEELRYNHKSKNTSLIVWLPIIAGTNFVDPQAWSS